MNPVRPLKSNDKDTIRIAQLEEKRTDSFKGNRRYPDEVHIIAGARSRHQICRRVYHFLLRNGHCSAVDALVRLGMRG